MQIMLVLVLMLSMMLSPMSKFFSDKQRQFYFSELKDYNILSGVTGSGKSFVANLKIYQALHQVPEGSTALITGNTDESLYDNIIKPLIGTIDYGIGDLKYIAVANRKRLVLQSRNVEAVCLGANNERAQDRIQGKNVVFWYADEIVKQPKSFVEMAISRCRYEMNGKIQSTPKIWTCNPDSPLHFIKTNYIDNTNLDIANWYFGFYDNPRMTKEFVDSLKTQLSGVFAERMLYGRWVMASGVIYDRFDPAIHIIDSFDRNLVSDYFLGIDFGYENPMAILLIGKTKDNQFIVLDEIYEKHLIVNKELANRIQDTFQVDINTAYCDPARPEYIMQLQMDLPCNVGSARNDVTEGIQEVQKYFITRGNNEQGIYILSKCVNTIRELSNYRWKESRGGISKDEPVKENDHLMDALRYVIYSQKTNYDFSGLKHSFNLQENGYA